MRRFVVLAIALGLINSAVAAESYLIDNRSYIIELLDIGDYQTAAPLIDDYLVKKPKDGEMHFFAARTYAQLNQPEYADQLLLDALKNGFQDFSVMSRHPDLKPIRDDGIYQVIMKARDAADDILALRRVSEWLKKFDNSSYQHIHSEGSKYDFITTLDTDNFKLLENKIELLGESIASNIFGADLNNRILIAFPLDSDKSQLLPDKNAQGRYIHKKRELIATDVGMTLQHELVHAFHHNQMDMLGQEHPLWIQEGMASLFESIEISQDGTVHFYANDRYYTALKLAKRNELLSLQSLFILTTEVFNENPMIIYAQVRSLFEFMAEKKLFARWYKLYINKYDTDSTGMLALEDVFELNANEIHKEWKNWIVSRSPEFKSNTEGYVITTSVLKFDSTTIEIEPVEIDSSISEEEIRVTRAEELYKSVKPELLSDYNNAVNSLLEVIALNPDHASAHYDLGLAYINTGQVELAGRQVAILRRLDKNLYNMLGNLCRKHETSQK